MRVQRLPFQGRFDVLVVCDHRGQPLLLDFFEGLGPNLEKDMDHMLQLLERVAAEGPPRNTEVSHKIQGEIWEFIKGRLRVFWFYDKGRVVVCTHGMVKKTQKTPRNEVQQAVRLHQAYMAAREAGRLEIEEEHNG